MRLVQLDTQGESQTAMINPDQVAFISQNIYGTSVHFASGEYLICLGELNEVAARLFGAETPASDYLISTPATPISR